MLINISELFFNRGLSERGLALLAFSRHHSASEQETKDRAEQTLKRYEAKFTPEQFATAIQQGQASDLTEMVAAIQNDLVSMSTHSPPQAESSPTATQPSTNQPLLDPLTERELEILQLIAAGRTNREIGEELVLALGSVKWYASQIYSKLQVKNRTEAAAKARALKLLA
jgi:LuxR family maltose regulon positive regulatory protein